MKSTDKMDAKCEKTIHVLLAQQTLNLSSDNPKITRLKENGSVVRCSAVDDILAHSVSSLLVSQSFDLCGTNYIHSF